MVLYDRGGRALDKGLVSQLVLDCSQFLFDLRDFFIQSSALCITIAGCYLNPNFSHLAYSDYCSYRHFELNGFNRSSAKKSRKCGNFFLNV